MYTIGQVAKFLGVSRDTLKFYEDKGLVKPQQNDENRYRLYDQFDIYDIITTNFYRDLDIEIKKIQEIRRNKSIDEVKAILEEKEDQIIDEIRLKKQLLNQIKYVKEDCGKINEYLGKFVIKKMNPIEVKGKITDLSAYDEYDVIHNYTDKTRITYNGLRRFIKFDEKRIIEDYFF